MKKALLLLAILIAFPLVSAANCEWWDVLCHFGNVVSGASSAIALPFAAVGQDSDLLLLSGGSIFYQYGEGETPAKYVRALFSLGGNDVAYVGSYDSETINQQSNVPSTFTNAGYTISAKKNSMDIVYSLNAGSTAAYKELSTSYGNALGSCGIGCDVDTEIKNLAKSKLANSCPSYSSSLNADLRNFSWYTSSKSCNVAGCWFGASYEVTYYCIYRSRSNSITIYPSGFDSGTIEYDIDVSVANKDGQSVSAKITPQNSRANLVFNNNNVGFISYAGSLINQVLPQTLSGYVGYLEGATLYPITSGAYGGGTDFTNLLNRTSSFNYSTCSSDITQCQIVNENGAAIISELSNLSTVYKNRYNTIKSSKLTSVGGKNITTTSNKVYFSDGITSLVPTMVLNLQGEWLGIKENTPILTLNCNSGFSGYLGQTLVGSFTVANTSQVSGNYSVTVTGCPSSYSYSDSLAAGQTKSFNTPFIFNSQGTGNCVVTLQYSGKSLNCSMPYTVAVQPHEAYCGNGVVDAGELCSNCAIDYEAQFGSGYCVEPDTCGNGSLDAGETCNTCPQDVESYYGSGYCSPISCGNGIADSGENCINCPVDIIANGGTCGTKDNTVLLIIMALVSIILGGISVYSYQKWFQ